MAFVGLVLGVFGMQRYYLKQRIMGTLMSAVFLLGVVLIVSYYAGIVSDMLSAALAFDSGGNFSDIPDLTQALNARPPRLYAGGALCVLGAAWLVIDLFRLPSLVRKYREGRL